MDNQRIEIRPPLGTIDFRDRLGPVGPRGQAIDGLGRQGDQASAAQAIGCSRNPGGVGSADLCGFMLVGHAPPAIGGLPQSQGKQRR